MSGFFGIFSPKGKVDKSAFHQMLQYSRNGAFDSLDTVVFDHISIGHMMLRVSPEAEYDQQPLQSNCGNFLLAGHFRLDYRDELGDKLGFGFQELKTMPDSLLVLLAFQKWKENCVHHLEGDWTFVLYDKTQNKLFMSKDKTGVSALFHIKVGEQVFFSSDTPTILSVTKQDVEIDYRVFFRYAQLGSYPEGGRTLIKGLKYLNNAEYLVYDRQLKKETFSYWSLENIPPIRFRFEEDYVHGLFSVYSDAIRSRLRTGKDLGLFLSGGLDSTSVASMAALELQTKNRVLNTYTSYPHYESMLPVSNNIMYNEVPLVKELASKYGNLHTHFFDFPNASLKDQFDSVQTMDAYYPIVSKNSFWIKGIMEYAQAKGVKRILMGQLGNYTITWTSPYVYTALLYRFSFVKLFKEIRRDLLCSGKTMSTFLVDHLLRPLKARLDFVFFSSNKIIERGAAPFFNKNHQKYISYSFKEKSKKILQLKKLTQGANADRLDRLKNLIPFAGVMWAVESNRNGLEATDPTADSRLFNYTFSIPENLFYRSSYPKYIFKRMMMDLLPITVLNNDFLKLQAQDFVFRISNDKKFNKFFQRKSFQSKSLTPLDVTHLAQLYQDIIANPKDFLRSPESQIFLNILSLHVFCTRIQ